MNISHIQQIMLKYAAASNSGQNHVDQTRVYTEKPPDRADVHIGPGYSYDDGYIKETQESFRDQKGSKWRELGATPYGYSFNTKTDNPYITWGFALPMADGSKKDYYSRVYPNQLWSARAGARLMAPSYYRGAGSYEPGRGFTPDVNRSGAYEPGRDQPFIPDAYRLGQNGRMNINPAWLDKPNEQTIQNIIRAANLGAIRFTTQPFNNRELSEIMTGDPSYWKNRWAHYEQVPEEYWDKARLSRSSREEATAAADYVPPLNLNGTKGSGSYSSSTGEINMSPTTAYNRYLDGWGSRANKDWDSRIEQTTYASRNNMTNDPSAAGEVLGTFNHENTHQKTWGRADWVYNPTTRTWGYVNAPFDPNKPISDTNVLTLMRMKSFDPLYFTKQQFDWVKKHAIEPYIMSDSEANQALVSFNTGRHALKYDMENNPDNPNYKYLEDKYPGLIEKFKALPDFIQPGEEGRKQLDDVMQLFITNPQLRVLMPEQARAVGYYHSLKSAVDTAKTPEEKQYFQNLMDHFIYSKSFLADNQQNRPKTTYADAYRMYA